MKTKEFKIDREYNDYIWALYCIRDLFPSEHVRKQFEDNALEKYQNFLVKSLVLQAGEEFKDIDRMYKQLDYPECPPHILLYISQAVMKRKKQLARTISSVFDITYLFPEDFIH